MMRPARSLALAVPARSEHAAKATEKWLLSLWQATPKATWSLWRSRAQIALEYLALDAHVSLRVHFRSPPLGDLTTAVLPALIPGLELEQCPDDALDFSEMLENAAVTTIGLRSPGWLDLAKDDDPESVHGVLDSLAGLSANGTALIQLLLDPTWMTTDDGKQPAFWLAGRVVVGLRAGRDPRNRTHLLASSFGQLAGFNGLRFSPAKRMTRRDVRAISERRPLRRLLPSLLTTWSFAWWMSARASAASPRYRRV